METKSKAIENVENIKISDETKKTLIALVNFEESFWNVCEILTPKSDDEEVQQIYNGNAEKELKKARDNYYNSYSEFVRIIKDDMFQTFFETGYKEI